MSKKLLRQPPPLPPPVLEDDDEEMVEREEIQQRQDSESETESGSESESSKEKTKEEDVDGKSDSDTQSEDQIAFTVKPSLPVKSAKAIPSTPPGNSASTSKRPAETGSKPKKSKMMKVSNSGDKTDAKKRRVWTEEDELSIFNGLIEYQKTNKVPVSEADFREFHKFFKNNLQLHADPRQLGDKIRKLKKKYFNKSQDRVFIKTHEIKMFQLSKEIWGFEDNGLDGSEKVAEEKKDGREKSAEEKSAEEKSEEKFAEEKSAEEKSAEQKSTEKKEDQKFTGGAKTKEDDFWSKYPSLFLCLRSQGGSDLSLILMQKVPMLGSSIGEKLAELERVWNEIGVAEMQLGYKKYDVRRKLTQLVLDLMKE